jgi:crotonobetainyl-CoA:carnitine CoA-transferase CaiB-like acyl-CoA transferase
LRVERAACAGQVTCNDALVALLADKLRQPLSEHRWVLESLGIPAKPVLHYDEVYTDPRILARDMVVETVHPVAGPFRATGVSVKLSATPGSVGRAAP